MKRKYVNPYLRIIGMESDGMLAMSPQTSKIIFDESPATEMETNHRRDIWEEKTDIWK